MRDLADVARALHAAADTSQQLADAEQWPVRAAEFAGAARAYREAHDMIGDLLRQRSGVIPDPLSIPVGSESRD